MTNAEDGGRLVTTSLYNNKERVRSSGKTRACDYWTVDKFHFYQAGRSFQVEADHKSSVSILGTKGLVRAQLRMQHFLCCNTFEDDGLRL